MRRYLLLPSLTLILAVPALTAQQSSVTAPTALTIYNQDFAVARTTVPLDLKSGVNEVLTTNVTSQLEPDSVVLRDASGRNPISVIEQNYDAGVVNQQWLLEKYEGKMLDFQIRPAYTATLQTGETREVPPQIVQGRVIRAGNNPLIEFNGHMQFQLPGTPVFPANTDGLLLKPTLRWQIQSAKTASFPAELAYITRGMSWQATYNVVEPETSDTTATELADIVGWVTIRNDSGTDFPQATIQLMAGDVAKIQNMQPRVMLANQSVMAGMGSGSGVGVTQQAFDDFHLYDLHRTLALHNTETKQVQFLEASKVTVQRTYQFEGNGAVMQTFYPGFHNDQQYFGNSGNTHVSVLQEIKNSDSNHLGMPLPAGRLRLYRRDSAGQMQFIGENMIQHTPAEQTVKIVSGNAFDLTAARRQTDFHTDTRAHIIDESFEIKLFNQKPQPVTIHAVEHMSRAQNWEITAKSADYTKRDSSTIDFPITVPAKGDITLTYTVHYTW
jgi:hypothetical protein